MKPVLIIGIAVGCSVVAVFGILFGSEAYQQKVAQDEALIAQQFDRDVTLLTQSYHDPAKKCFTQYEDCMVTLKEDYKVSLGLLMDEYGYVNKEEMYQHTVKIIEYEFDIALGKYVDRKYGDLMNCDSPMECYWASKKATQP